MLKLKLRSESALRRLSVPCVVFGLELPVNRGILELKLWREDVEAFRAEGEEEGEGDWEGQSSERLSSHALMFE